MTTVIQIISAHLRSIGAEHATREAAEKSKAEESAG